MRALLASKGVDAAVGIAWQYDPEQIQLAIVRWEERRADGDDLGPGWIVWLLRQGPVDKKRQQRRDQTAEWMERRYERGKGAE